MKRGLAQERNIITQCITTLLNRLCLTLLFSFVYCTHVYALNKGQVEASVEHDSKVAVDCQSIVSQHYKEHDLEIQQGLNKAFIEDQCFIQDAQAKGNLLNDGIVGPITKTWIKRYIDEFKVKSCAPEKVCNHNVEPVISEITPHSGLSPFILVEDDITYFEVNSLVLAILQKNQGNTYITESRLLEALKKELQLIKGMSDYLILNYLKVASQYIQQASFMTITQEGLDLLIANDLIIAAQAVSQQADVLMVEESYQQVVRNLVRSAYLEDQLKQTKNGGQSETGNKNETDHAGDTEQKMMSQKEKQQSVAKTQQLSEKNRKKVDAALSLVKISIKNSTLFRLWDIQLSSEFPEIDKDILLCAANMLDVAFISQSAFESALKTMLVKLERKQQGKKVKYFNCKVTIKKKPSEPDEEPEESNQQDSERDNKKVNVNPLQSKSPEYDTEALELLVKRATKSFYKTELTPIELVPVAKCVDCTLPFKGVNYGFYPFWNSSLAYRDIGKFTVNPAAIDFSMFNRIAYFGLPVAIDGEISDWLHWEDIENIRNYSETLERYNVKRDLVLYFNSWLYWGANKSEYDKKQLAYEYAEKHLLALRKINRRLDENIQLNGITLYFDSYTNSSDANMILNYVYGLHQKMVSDYKNDKKKPFDVNLMLGISWNYDEPGFCQVRKVREKEETYFSELKPLLISTHETNNTEADTENALLLDKMKRMLSNETGGASRSIISNLLLVLEEPTSRSKKCLRLQVENELYGEDRIDFLRKIIPVVERIEIPESGDKRFQLFKNDVSYLKDNFGGIGFWPVPMVVPAEAGKEPDTVYDSDNELLIEFASTITVRYLEPYKNYLDYSKTGTIGEFLHNPIITRYISVCAFACPKRNGFFYLFGGLFLISAVSFIAFRVNCKARKRIIRFKWLDLCLKSAMVLTFLSMLGCDPDWQPFSNGILAILFVYMFVYFVYSYFFCGYEKQSNDFSD